ncbi:hypothetical protein [Spirosoma rigui]|uniref:hypothetical protein n=1 Tax=Spirosoma rigui TaxID=564064 RepID=UPI0009AFF88A|nr:hypothetical protein [Spirosoma rigui]
MKQTAIGLLLVLVTLTLRAQPPAPTALVGRFLTDSIDIGRPFQYSLTYRHPPSADLLFPDTASQFAPYRVEKVALFTTRTTGTGFDAVSTDSAVYTLLSFETDSVQLLRVPIRLINATDCTDLYTQIDTVFLRSQVQSLPGALANAASLTLATETTLAPLQQQFNYPVLGLVVAGLALVAGILYVFFGRTLQRQWRLFRLNRRHRQFLRDFDQLSQGISPATAADVANQAVINWKTYLEKIERQPYSSLTTSEIAERVNDERVTNALREADLMIYGGAFSQQSAASLRVLSEVATQRYYHRRADLQASVAQPAGTDLQPDPADSPVSP